MELKTLAGRQQRWRFFKPRTQTAAVSRQLADQLQIHELVARLLVRRGIQDAQTADRFLGPKLTDLHDPALLGGIHTAVSRLMTAVAQGQKIVIYGDYDVDGITASSILWHVLRLAGGNVSTYTPHRVQEGYGLNSEAIAQLSQDPQGRPLIVSVDCGITAHEPARRARQCGVDLIITDHHEFDQHDLPDALAIVHPRVGPSAYPFGALCGAGVAFKVAWQFAKVHCGSDRVARPFRDLLLDLLCLAALGTVADVVPLVDENRIIAACGLNQIKRSRLGGLNALIDATGLRQQRIDSYHVGFVLGPRLNACGRMGHARQAVELLTSASASEAVRIAAFLARQNQERRATERVMLQEARTMIVEAGYDRPDQGAIVLGKPGWHRGVMGIVASRLVERYCRPVVLLSFQDGRAQGSARSVPGLSIHEAMHGCHELLDEFGGHAMAAGCSLQVERVPALRQRLIRFINERLGPQDRLPVLDIDAVCTLGDLGWTVVGQIQRLAPFGRANPAPVLCLRNVAIDGHPRRVGTEGSHLRLMLREGPCRSAAIGFGLGELVDHLAPGDRVDVAIEPKMSTWCGRQQIDLHVKDLRPAADR